MIADRILRRDDRRPSRGDFVLIACMAVGIECGDARREGVPSAWRLKGSIDAYEDLAALPAALLLAACCCTPADTGAAPAAGTGAATPAAPAARPRRSCRARSRISAATSAIACSSTIDKYDLTPEAQQHAAAPGRLAEDAIPTSPSPIEGHCDERGTREYNLALGERRANAVAELPGRARHPGRAGSRRSATARSARRSLGLERGRPGRRTAAA